MQEDQKLVDMLAEADFTKKPDEISWEVLTHAFPNFTAELLRNRY